MAKQRCTSFSRSGTKVFQHSPYIFGKNAEEIVLTTEYPRTNLKPNDFELDTLLSAGVDVKSKVNYEEPSSIDRIDVVLSGVVENLDKSETKKND